MASGPASSSCEGMSPTIASRMSVSVTRPARLPYSSITSAIWVPDCLNASSTLRAGIVSGT